MSAFTSHSIGQSDLAKLAGVSQKTVSRALNGETGVSDATRRQIEALAAQHAYRPNASARSTRSGRFGSITLLLGTHGGQSNLPPGLLNGVQDALTQRDLNLMVVKLGDDQLTDTDTVPTILREARSDGMLIDYTHGFPPRMQQLIDDFGIPAVWINTKRTTNTVYPDDLAAGRTATERLIALGHTRIAYADFTHGPDHPAKHYSVVDRQAGYTQAMGEAGLEPRLMQWDHGADIPRPERIDFARGLLAGIDRPTAILCYAETSLAPIYIAAAKQGLDVPSDLSLATFSGEPSRLLGPAPTTELIPEDEVGQMAVRLLLERLSQPRKLRDLPAVAVPFTFEPGQTSKSVSV